MHNRKYLSTTNTCTYSCMGKLSLHTRMRVFARTHSSFTKLVLGVNEYDGGSATLGEAQTPSLQQVCTSFPMSICVCCCEYEFCSCVVTVAAMVTRACFGTREGLHLSYNGLKLYECRCCWSQQPKVWCILDSTPYPTETSCNQPK